MSKVKIYISGVRRERARDLILQHIDSDPSLASLRELYDLDTADPDLDIINVTGLKCAGVPIGTPEFVDALCAQRLMTSSRTCKSFASYRIPKSTMICFAFVSTHASHSSPAMCPLT